jgi:hypothetical protein
MLKTLVYQTDQLQDRVTIDGTDDVNAPLLIVTMTSVSNIRFVLKDRMSVNGGDVERVSDTQRERLDDYPSRNNKARIRYRCLRWLRARRRHPPEATPGKDRSRAELEGILCRHTL